MAWAPAWVADNEPELLQRARRLFMPSSWLAFQLTDQYVLDQQLRQPVHTALRHRQPGLVPAVGHGDRAGVDPGDVAGRVTAEAAAVTGARDLNLAGGLATSGAITAWLRDLFGSPDFPELLRLAELSGPGARGW
ncbi:hypothetical protein [Micromonospora rhizosphaerae]|uniref:hypothetical protein n=1 Tax=Micromonospora rhizosphaerae TaxID=568872 RepID=UPI000B82046C|nr:hypothetical protein [Micromonospora rhizosphaerae]